MALTEARSNSSEASARAGSFFYEKPTDGTAGDLFPCKEGEGVFAKEISTTETDAGGLKCESCCDCRIIDEAPGLHMCYLPFVHTIRPHDHIKDRGLYGGHGKSISNDISTPNTLY